MPLPRPKAAIPEPKPETAQEPEGAQEAEPAPEAPAAAARAACAAELRRAGMSVSAVDPILRGECSITDPVSLKDIDTRFGKVTLPAGPVVDCAFAAVLGAWTREILAPVAAALMDSPLEAILTGPGYQCRARSRDQDGKMSEHAFGRAIDITGLELADGRRVLISSLLQAQGADRELLDAMTTSACGYFATVLGPGSDPAHADHLHVDTAQRRTTDYRICMMRQLTPPPPLQNPAAP